MTIGELAERVGLAASTIRGTAYDDKWLGRDPQPSHMHDHVASPVDNGGVHVNSGIPNRAFALAARALGGYTWSVLGRIWYRVLTGKLTPQTNFRSFAYETVAAAAELYRKPRVLRTVADAWAQVGLPVTLGPRSRVSLFSSNKPSTNATRERKNV